ncbi:MAG: TrmB family transcriptional regulator [Thermoplasmata archaeon]
MISFYTLEFIIWLVDMLSNESSPVSNETIIQYLKNIGFSDDEAKVYFTLSLYGPLTASEVSVKTKIPRVNTYRVLQSLEKRGILESTIERPMKFVAMPLKNVVSILTNEVKEQLNNINKNKEELQKLWSFAKPTEDITGKEEKIRIIEGRSSIDSFIKMKIEQAKKNIKIVTTKYNLYRITEYISSLELKNKDNVKIYFVTEVCDTNYENAKKFDEIGTLYHCVNVMNSNFIIIDDSEVMIFLISDTALHTLSKNETILWTNSKAVINITNQIINLLLSKCTNFHTKKIEKDIMDSKDLSITFFKNDPKSFQLFHEIIQFVMVNFSMNELKIPIEDFVQLISKNIAITLLKGIEYNSKEELFQKLSEKWKSLGRGKLEFTGKNEVKIEISKCSGCSNIQNMGEEICAEVLRYILISQFGVDCNIVPQSIKVGEKCIFVEG